MHKHGSEVHVTPQEARAGTKSNTVRWILAISLLATVILFAIIVLVGAGSQDEQEAQISVDAQIREAEDEAARNVN